MDIIEASLARAKQKAVDLKQSDLSWIRTYVSSIFDVWIVTETSENLVLAKSSTIESARPQKIVPLVGARMYIGDEVVVVKIGGRWIGLGCIRSAGEGFSSLQSTPTVVPPFIRRAAGQPSNAWTSTTDFASVRQRITGLDPGQWYLVESRADIYLKSGSSGISVGAGVRVGFASDPKSVSSSEWGPGHTNTFLTLSSSSFSRVVSSMTEIEITGRAFASGSGSHEIGDAALYTTITPLYVGGRL